MERSRQFSTSRFSLNSTTPSVRAFRRELRFVSRPGRRSFATAIRPTFFYVMLEGELRVTKYYGDQEIFLAEVSSGGVLWRD